MLSVNTIWKPFAAPAWIKIRPKAMLRPRAIAYGFALVVFARIEGRPSRCRHTATESNPEQNRIQCGTTELPLRSDPSRKVKYGRNFSICDSPAGAGGKTKQGFVARRASKKMDFFRPPPLPANTVFSFQRLFEFLNLIRNLALAAR